MNGTRGRVRMRLVAAATAALAVAGTLGTVPMARASGTTVFDPHGTTTEVATGELHRDADDFSIGDFDPLTGAQTRVHSTVYTRNMPAGWRYPLIVMAGPNFDNLAQYAVHTNPSNADYMRYYFASPDCAKGQDSTGTEVHCLIGDFTRYGYAVAYVDAVGTGLSSGTWDMWGDNVNRGYAASIRHFRAEKRPDGKPRFGRIGAFGGSAEAGSAIHGAAYDDGKGPLPLSAMVLAEPLVNFYNTYATQGAVYDSAWEMVPTYQTFPLLPAWDATASKTPDLAQQKLHSGVPSSDAAFLAAIANQSGAESPYWQARDARFGIDRVRAPLLAIAGLQDVAVNSTTLAELDRVPALKRYILQNNAHDIPWRADPTYPWWEAFHAWFDFYLLGEGTDPSTWPAVQVQCATGTDPTAVCPSGRWRTASSVMSLGAPATHPLDTGLLPLRFGEALPDATAPVTGFKMPMHISGPVTLALDIDFGPVKPSAAVIGLYLEHLEADGKTVDQIWSGYCRYDPSRARSTLGDRCSLDDKGRILVPTAPIDHHYADGTIQVRLVAKGDYHNGGPLKYGGVMPAGTGWIGTVNPATSTLTLGTADDSHPLCIATQEACS